MTRQSVANMDGLEQLLDFFCVRQNGVELSVADVARMTANKLVKCDLSLRETRFKVRMDYSRGFYGFAFVDPDKIQPDDARTIGHTAWVSREYVPKAYDFLKYVYHALIGKHELNAA